MPKKDFKDCFFEGFQIANFALLQKVKEFKTSNFAKFERSLYLILTIFKISNFKTSKDKNVIPNINLEANLLGRSWGSFWPPGGDFFAVFGGLFWRLGPGPREN